MATFTMALKDVLELDPTIEPEILGNYPLFDEAHREELNRKIIRHYWNQEIGHETISLFRLALARRLDEVMPLYNQHYEISAVKFNQLETIRVRNRNETTTESTSAGTGETTSASGAKSRAVAQELPQTMLSGDGDYATSAQDNISDTNATGATKENSTASNKADADNVTTGFQGNAAMMLLQYRQSLVNVDMMVINDLETLFMQLWSNGDNFAGNGNYYYGYGAFPLLP